MTLSSPQTGLNSLGLQLQLALQLRPRSSTLYTFFTEMVSRILNEVISPNGQWIKWSFHQMVISSNGHFIKWSFHQMVISSNGHFIKWSFHQMVISSNDHFIHSFCCLFWMLPYALLAQKWRHFYRYLMIVFPNVMITPPSGGSPQIPGGVPSSWNPNLRNDLSPSTLLCSCNIPKYNTYNKELHYLMSPHSFIALLKTKCIK